MAGVYVLRLVMRPVIDTRFQRKVVSRSRHGATADGNRRNAGNDLATLDEMNDKLMPASKGISRCRERIVCSVKEKRFEMLQVLEKTDGAQKMIPVTKKVGGMSGPRASMET